MHGPLNFDSIPSAFKTQTIFLCWKYGPVQTNGKRTKIPIDKSGRAISPVEPALWRNCYEVIGQYEAGHADGVGIAITRDNGVIGIDLDHSVTDGVIEQWALAIMATCTESFWEYSPSGTGLHGFVKGSLPIGHATKKENVEVYSDKRYLTFTGNRLPSAGNEVATATDAFYEWYGKTFTPAPTPLLNRIVEPLQAIGRDDAALIAKIRTSAKGETFSALFDGTNVSTDDSKNDIKLCGILASWSGKDAEQIDSIFRASALYREKWDRKTGEATYGQRTIGKAIANCTFVVEAGWKPQKEKREGETQNRGCGAVACIPPLESIDSDFPSLSGLPVSLLDMGAAISPDATEDEKGKILLTLYRRFGQTAKRYKFAIGDAYNAMNGNDDTKSRQLRLLYLSDTEIQVIRNYGTTAGQFPPANRNNKASWSALVELAAKTFTQAERQYHINRRTPVTEIRNEKRDRRAEEGMSPKQFANDLFRQLCESRPLTEVIALLKPLVGLETYNDVVIEMADEEAHFATEALDQQLREMDDTNPFPCVYTVYPPISRYENLESYNDVVMDFEETNVQHTSRDTEPEPEAEGEPMILEVSDLRSLDDHLYLEFGALIDKADCNALLTEYVLADGSTVDMNLLAERAFDQRDQAQLEFIDNLIHPRYTNRKELLACAIVTSSQTPSSLFNPSATVLPPFNQPAIESHCLSMAT